jgi:phosphoserine aminotransferase
MDPDAGETAELAFMSDQQQPDALDIPADLLPADGRFGAGPSKVRQEGVEALATAAPGLLGTSHRQTGVKELVRRVREGLAAFFDPPSGYEVALGNGGASLFWDAATQGLIIEQSAHAVFGEFSTKFAKAVADAPELAEPLVAESDFGTHPDPAALVRDDVDFYALTHCETSTGVTMPVARPAVSGLVAVDATSAAGGLDVDLSQADAYYFSPQKGFGSEGGLWVALLSPAALARLDEVAAIGRHAPAMLDLRTAVENSRKNQTYNTPSTATLFLMAEQLDWMNAAGGLQAVAKECAAKAAVVYDWAERSEYAAPFVADPDQRSDVVCTVDLDPAVPADEVTSALRAHGVVDTEAYRKLGRNQLRISVYPAVALGDVEALVATVDYLATRLAA